MVPGIFRQVQAEGAGGRPGNMIEEEGETIILPTFAAGDYGRSGSLAAGGLRMASFAKEAEIL